MRLRMTIICTLLLLQACTHGPSYMPSGELNDTNAATLLIYTPNTEFNRQNFITPTITINGESLGKTSIEKPIKVLIPTGDTTLRFQRAVPIMPSYEAGNIHFKAEANTHYYVRYSYDFDDRPVKVGDDAPASGASSFRLVDQSTAESGQ